MSTSATAKYPFLDPPMDSEDLGALGPYRVISELGRGGMGYVFRAEDTRLKRVVALKMMNQKIAATADSRRRFIEEARSMAAVKHDNVATIYEVNDQYATPFMAMELLKGGTLEDKSRTIKRFDYQTVIRCAMEIARGLSAAHAQGIIHRDIKPANIWIEADSDRIKILDFGLALANVTVDQIAARGSVIGTPQYLSPEQASSEPLDDRTDLYSLGVVLFELCTGQLPFQASNVAEQLIATLVHKPLRANKINPEIPEPLAALIGRLLEKEPRRRPRSASELEKSLEKVAIECEAKSDVAQAINKLQAQLSLVTTKQPDPFAIPSSDFGLGLEVAATGVGGFDELPLPGPAYSLPAAIAPPSIGKPGRAPAAFGKPAVAAPPNSGDETFLRYWPLAAIGATTMVLIAIVAGVWYGTMSASSREGNVVILPAAEALSGGPLPSPTAPVPSPPIQPSVLIPAQSLSEQDHSVDASIDLVQSTPAPNLTASNPNGSGKKKKRQASNETPALDRADPSAPMESATGEPSAESRTMNELASNPTNTSRSEPDFAPEPAAVIKSEPPLVSERISRRTSDGRGADTTVKRGSSKTEQLGQDLSIAIQTRGAVDIQHSYIRFDTKGMRSSQQVVAGVELVLSVPGSPVPAGAHLRVYGVPEEARDDWAESGVRSLHWSTSLSREPLTGLSLLAEMTSVGDESATEWRIRDDRMTEFVQNIKEEFVTFILAGGSPENKPLYFVSREGDRERAPTLHLEVVDAKKTNR